MYDFSKQLLTFVLHLSLINRKEWAAVGQRAQLSHIFTHIPDEFLYCGQLPPTNLPRVFFVGSDAAAAFPSDLPQLAALSRQAPFGKGLETIVDTDVRRVLETDQCRIEWDISPTLANVAEKFSLPATLNATFYKLLYYRDGDFFLTHYDR